MTVPPATSCHSVCSVAFAAAAAAGFSVAVASYPPANSYYCYSSFRAYLTTYVVGYCRPAVVVVASVSIDGVVAEPFAIDSALIADPFPRSLDIR